MSLSFYASLKTKTNSNLACNMWCLLKMKQKNLYELRALVKLKLNLIKLQPIKVQTNPNFVTQNFYFDQNPAFYTFAFFHVLTIFTRVLNWKLIFFSPTQLKCVLTFFIFLKTFYTEPCFLCKFKKQKQNQIWHVTCGACKKEKKNLYEVSDLDQFKLTWIKI